MNSLKPELLFQRIVEDIPSNLHNALFVTGSLAAAYHFKDQLKDRAVNTKDADLIVHPAGNVQSCKKMATQLINIEWKKTEDCYPQPTPEPMGKLRAIRLYPPGSDEYFIEFLNLPEKEQVEAKRWIPVQLDDGYYGLPSFRFMGLTELNRQRSKEGLEYASPAMMALSNLLSHPELGTTRIESGDMEGILRSAKDLGRVIALARLAGGVETEKWLEVWSKGIQSCFPINWKLLAVRAGNGLRELLQDRNALDEAHQTTEIGLLNGQRVTADNLAATGGRLIQDLIEPFEQLGK